MKISPFVAKVGSAGALATTASGGVAIYLAWDHITLYEVEREVISKELKLKVTGPTATPKIIKIEAPKEAADSEPKLSSDQTWSCEVTVNPKANDTSSYTNFAEYIKSHLQDVGPTSKNQLKTNKELLVRACAKKRAEGTQNDKSVKGTLTLVNKDDAKVGFTFQDHSYLDFLLENALYEVEQEVIDKDVRLKIDPESGTNTPLTVSIDTTNPNPVLGENHSWSCEITLEGDVGTGEPNLATTIKGHLLKNNDPLTQDQKRAKEKLVRACSKTKKSGSSASNTSVIGTLKIKKKDNPNTEKIFENHPELDYLLKAS